MRRWLVIMVALMIWIASCTSTGETYYSSTGTLDFSKYKTYKWLPKDSSTITNVLFDNTILANAIEKNSNKILSSKGYVQNSDSADLLLQYTFIVEDKEKIITNRSITQLPEAGPRVFFQPFSPYIPTSAYNGIGPYPGVYAPYDSPQSIYYYENNGNVYTPGYNANNYPYYSPYGFPYNGNNYIANDVQSFTFRQGTLIIDFIDSKTKEIVYRSWNVDGLSDPNSFKNSVPGVIREILQDIPSR